MQKSQYPTNTKNGYGRAKVTQVKRFIPSHDFDITFYKSYSLYKVLLIHFSMSKFVAKIFEFPYG